MAFLNDIAVITNAFKSYHSDAYLGHWVQVCGTWDGESYTAEYSTFKHTETSFTPVSLVFVTSQDSREYDVTLTFTVKTCKRKKDSYGNEEYITSEQLGMQVKKPVYEHDSTEQVSITIDAWERAGTAIKIGTSSNIYEIVSVTQDISIPGIGAGYVYALASVGSKMIYSLSFNRLMQELQDITHGIFISPPFCRMCSGTGTIGSEVCPQCNGFMFSGRGAIEYLAKRHGDEVGIGQDAERTFERFQHEVWMQKWWITPTISQIKRLFAFFCDITEDSVYIEERYDDFEPAWHLLLPTNFGPNSQFSWENSKDTVALRLLLESVTPAGTIPYLTYYSNDFGTTYAYVKTSILDRIWGRTAYPCAQFGAEWDANSVFPSSGFGYPYQGMEYYTQWRKPEDGEPFSGQYLW